jgi:hypothetical protein
MESFQEKFSRKMRVSLHLALLCEKELAGRERLQVQVALQCLFDEKRH